MKSEKIAARSTLAVIVVASLAVAAPAVAHHRSDHAGGAQPTESPTEAVTATPTESTPVPGPTISSLPDPWDSPRDCSGNDVPDQYPWNGGAMGIVQGVVLIVVNPAAEIVHDVGCLVD